MHARIIPYVHYRGYVNYAYAGAENGFTLFSNAKLTRLRVNIA